MQRGLEHLRKIDLEKYQERTWSALQKNALPFLLCALVSNTVVLNGISPFAASLCGALYLRGRTRIGAPLGCLFGALLAGFAHAITFMVPIALLCGQAIHSLSKQRMGNIAVYVFCGAGGVLSVLLFAMDTLMHTISGGISVMLMLLFMPAFEYGISALIQLSRKRMLTEYEITALAFCGCVFLMGTTGLQMGRINVFLTASVMLVMVVAYSQGPILGACCGVIMGFCGLIGAGTSPILMASYGLCGLCCGLCNQMDRKYTMACFLMCNAIFMLYCNDTGNSLIGIWDIVMGGVLFLLVPQKTLDVLTLMGKKRQQRCAGGGLHTQALTQRTSEQLSALGQVYRQTAGVYAQRPRTEDRRMEKWNLAKKVCTICKSCQNYEDCWRAQNQQRVDALYRMYLQYAHGKKIRLPDALGQGCPRPHELEKSIYEVFRAIAQEQEHKNTILELKGEMKQQVSGMAESMEELSRRIYNDAQYDQRTEGRILEALKQEGIPCLDVAAFLGNEPVVKVQIPNCGGRKECYRNIRRVVTEACRMPMQPEDKPCGGRKQGNCTITYIPRQRIQVLAGTAQQNKPGQRISGDAFAFTKVRSANYLMCLCDGMGSGEEAAQASRQAASLIQGFYRAGFEEEGIIPNVNRLLMMRKKEVFSTVDILTVDLAKQKAKFIKTGAVPSYILREESMECIQCDALPVGIVEEVKPTVIQRPIEAGNVIIMMSDGVYDRMESVENLYEWMKAAIDEETEPQSMAENILRQARLLSAGHEDDMTVAVCKVAAN